MFDVRHASSRCSHDVETPTRSPCIIPSEDHVTEARRPVGPIPVLETRDRSAKKARPTSSAGPVTHKARALRVGSHGAIGEQETLPECESCKACAKIAHH